MVKILKEHIEVTHTSCYFINDWKNVGYGLTFMSALADILAFQRCGDIGMDMEGGGHQIPLVSQNFGKVFYCTGSLTCLTNSCFIFVCQGS